jgi:hypothetical protein
MEVGADAYLFCNFFGRTFDFVHARACAQKAPETECVCKRVALILVDADAVDQAGKPAKRVRKVSLSCFNISRINKVEGTW